MLESNPEWDLGGFQFVKFGASNETVKMGIHSGAFNFFGVSADCSLHAYRRCTDVARSTYRATMFPGRPS